MIEKPLYCFECHDCGYDWKEAKSFVIDPTSTCPMCASDSGHDIRLKTWVASAADIAWMDNQQTIRVRYVQ